MVSFGGSVFTKNVIDGLLTVDSLINLLILVGPYLLPRALAFYRSIRDRPRSQLKPVPPRVQRCLNILFGVVLACLLQTFPYFQPPNIFRQTNSRLGLPTNLIFTRLAALRPFTPLDEAVKTKFENETDRIRYLYAAYGPNVITECPFCQSTEPQSYFYYALPSILLPHIIHIIILGIITSSFLSGPEGNRWRTQATIAGVALATADLWMRWTYNWEVNITKGNLQDADFFFWRVQLYRNLGFALVDALFGWALWLTSTNRWLVRQQSVPERLAGVSQILQSTYQQTAILGPLRNAILRDQGLRDASEQYWTREPRVMEEIEREREVVDAKNLALSRLDFGQVQAKAQMWIDAVFGASGLRTASPQSQPEHPHSD